MKLLTIAMLCLVLVSSVFVSGYICLDGENDSVEVTDFKAKMNLLAVENDIEEHGLTKEAFLIKLKYFNPCR